MKPEFTKEFNADHAKAGAPYCCRNGVEATIVKFDCRHPNFVLVGVRGQSDECTSWTNKGGFYGNNDPCGHDLAMLPLGMIDGKPVFVGDELLDDQGHAFFVKPTPAEWLHTTGCAWPAPAKVYPATQIGDNDLCSAYYGGGPVVGATAEMAAFYRIANAALRHAIEAGQVITMADHHEEMAKLDDERDMAVAKAVRDACRSKFKEGFVAIPETCAYGRISGIDLAAIIAKIK